MLVREGNGAQLAEELHHLLGPRGRQVLGEAPGEPARRSSAAHRPEMPHSRRRAWAEQPSGGARAHRVPPASSTSSVRPRLLQAAQELVAQAGLAGAAGAVTSTAWAADSSTQVVKASSSRASSCSRPTQGVGLPSRGRDSSAPSCSPWSRKSARRGRG